MILRLMIIASLLFLGGCRSHRDEYFQCIAAIKSMPMYKYMSNEYGDDMHVVAIYYDGAYGHPRAVIECIVNRRYHIELHCDIEYSDSYRHASASSEWSVLVKELKKAILNDRGTVDTFYGRSWRFTEAQWLAALHSDDVIEALKIPVTSPAAGDGVDMAEKIYGRAISSSKKSSSMP